MKRALLLLLFLTAAAQLCAAQASGNVGYSQGGGSGRGRAEQEERTRRQFGQYELPPDKTSMFVEAGVLMNVKADEFVAVFGLAQECAGVPECNQKMDAAVAAFKAGLRRLGVAEGAVAVDFAAQNKIYGYQLTGNVAKERLVGFELKKNVAVHYREEAMLDRLLVAASQANIFDLIKVDYVVRDVAAVQARLADEAAKVVEQKRARYARLLGISLQPPAQIYAERHGVHYPTEMYDSYTAFESEDVNNPFERDRYTVQRARKSRTFFFNPLNADGFDAVVNPVVTEPVVQFTLYLKLRYEIQQPANK